MIITLTFANTNTFAIDTNAFSLAAYNRLLTFAEKEPNVDVVVSSYRVNNSGMLETTHYPASWTGEATPVCFSAAIETLNKLLG
jgi:hypothetical protein